MSNPDSVISNAGPLIALGKLGRLDLLAGLYDTVLLPEAVYDEVVLHGLARGETDARIVRLFWQQQKWPIVAVSPEIVAGIQTAVTLGQGEVAVLALASSLQNPCVLMDDALARAEARRRGFVVRGTLGVLVQAYRHGLLSLIQVELLIDEIEARPDIWISSQLCRDVLARLHNSVR